MDFQHVDTATPSCGDLCRFYSPHSINRIHWGVSFNSPVETVLTQSLDIQIVYFECICGFED